MHEALAENVIVLANELAQDLVAQESSKFAFFGHSMGALLAFEVARALRHLGKRTPEFLFVSAFRAPQLPSLHDPIANLPTTEFVREIQEVNSGLNEVFSNAELLELVVPIMRADVAMCETYQYQDEAPLPCRIVVFGGDQDKEVTYQELAAWRSQSEHPEECSVHLLPGDHFFIRAWQPAILEKIVAELTNSAAGD